MYIQLYLVFAARAADTVAAALLRTAALYLAGEEKVEKFRKPSKDLVTKFLVERLKLIHRERKEKKRGEEQKRKVRKQSIIKIR